ncbi:MAG: hypothetical protein HZB19_16040 [Chloroflexi bacterium]|nr:hypothetical protein [Chloroflexota bacterium]
MFDNLREEANASPFFEDEAKFQPAAGTTADPAMRKTKFLGMTPIQRFVIAVMMMIAVCTLGMMCLLITGKIGLF